MYSDLTPDHVALFALANDFTGYFGILIGLLIGGSLKAILKFLIDEVQRPRKVKVVLNNDNFQYFYLFKNKYYSRTDLALQRQNQINNIKFEWQSSPAFFLICSIILTLILSLSLTWFFYAF